MGSKASPSSKGHTEEIDVLAWSWGLSQSGTFASGGGGGAGKVNAQDLSITKYVDKASPELLLACSNGKHIKDAVLSIRKAGESPLEYLTITLEKVLVSSVSTGGTGGEDRLTENVTSTSQRARSSTRSRTTTASPRAARSPTPGTSSRTSNPERVPCGGLRGCVRTPRPPFPKRSEVARLSSRALFDDGNLRAALRPAPKRSRRRPTIRRIARSFSSSWPLPAISNAPTASSTSSPTRTPKQNRRSKSTATSSPPRHSAARCLAGEAQPEFLRDAPAYAHLHLEALHHLRDGESARAHARLEASAACTALAGELNGTSFEGLRDCDDVIAPFLELHPAARLRLAAVRDIREIEIPAPERPRDLIWTPVRFVLDDGSQHRAYVPVLYGGSHQHDDDQVRLGRYTDWQQTPGGPVRGSGQRMLLAGDDGHRCSRSARTFIRRRRTGGPVSGAGARAPRPVRRCTPQPASTGRGNSVIERSETLSSSSMKCGWSWMTASKWPGLPRFAYLDARIAQRFARPPLDAEALRIGDAVVGQPAQQVVLALPSAHRPAGLVAHHDLQVVREARRAEDVLQLRRQARVGRRVLTVVALRRWQDCAL